MDGYKLGYKAGEIERKKNDKIFQEKLLASKNQLSTKKNTLLMIYQKWHLRILLEVDLTLCFKHHLMFDKTPETK